jgi:hypothetical protein
MMYQKFFFAAFVCGVLFLCGATAEASMLGSFPHIQCAAPVLVKSITNFVIILITVAAFFLQRAATGGGGTYLLPCFFLRLGLAFFQKACYTTCNSLKCRSGYAVGRSEI